MRTKPLIIGVCGRARHGKDAAGTELRRLLGAQRIAYADHLKWLCMRTWDLSFDQVFGNELKETIDPRWGLSPRQFLQRMGTEVGRNIHPDTWVRKTLGTIDKAFAEEMVCWADLENKRFVEDAFFSKDQASVWYVPDVRFPSEAQAIRDRGGLILKIVRPNLERPADGHSSETSVDEIQEDYLIVNNADLASLYAKVAVFTQRITE